MTDLTIICAWCPDGDVKTKAAVARGEHVSHSMCPNCVRRMEAMLDKTVTFDHTSHGFESVAPSQRVIE